MARNIGHISGNNHRHVNGHRLWRGRELQFKFSQSFLETHSIQMLSGNRQLASFKGGVWFAFSRFSPTIQRAMIVGFGPKRCWSVLLAAAGLFTSASLWAQDLEVAPASPEE